MSIEEIEGAAEELKDAEPPEAKRGRGRPRKGLAIRDTIADAFVVLPIEELMRARGLSAHAACRIIAAQLHRHVSWSTHWKRYQRARKRSSLPHRTLREFLSQLSKR